MRAIAVPAIDARRQAYLLAAAATVVAGLGVLAQDTVAYFCVAIPVLLPLLFWLRTGAHGMPVLPALSVLFFVYYAMPLLRSEMAVYGPDELFGVASMVGAFLIAASVACWPFLGGPRRTPALARSAFVPPRQIVRLVFVGLGIGVVYHLAAASGYLDWTGSSIGVLRSIALTLSSVSCYLLGTARAARLLVGARWAMAVAGLGLLILLALSGLLLVGGIMNALAAVLGYVLTARRIPWRGLLVAFAVLSVLHAGKFEMRRGHWERGSQGMQSFSPLGIPGLVTEWFGAGVRALTSGGTESDVLERASLLHMLLRVQRATPDFIPYLEGDTYALLPSMLVPRFLDPDKPESQAGLNLLSLRYGIQVIGASASTTIGWGLIAEAYANFGLPGVITVGAAFGVLCGGLMRLSAGAAPLSLPMFITIAATLSLLNLELDFSYLITTLMQSIGAVLAFAALPRLLGGRPRAPRRPGPPWPMDDRPLGQAPSP